MNRTLTPRWLFATLAALVVVATACGSSSTPAATKGTITVAGFNFGESSILAEIYGQALGHDGYTVNYKLLLGTREVLAPAMQAGQVDLYPGYAASDLEYYNKKAGEATGDVTATTAKLNSHLQPLNLVALTPSGAVDQNAFAVTQDTAAKFTLSKLSDLAAIGNQLVLGAGPECPTRPYCLPGLQSVYGIHFKDFKALDTDGILTRAAFKNGSIQVGLVFSSDGDLNAAGLVVLQDDKHLEAADNVVPILRTAAATPEVRRVLNNIDAQLTTADLVTMNQKVAQHQDADVVATAYLQAHNYFS
jgi:osmoprotectant transport system substrate-binding protein